MTKIEKHRCIVVHPDSRFHRDLNRSTSAQVDEAAGLALAIHLEVVEAFSVRVSEVKSATLFGAGKVEEIGAKVAALEVTLVIVDATLSPSQQRNLEEAWACKVIDRTALILEIFGARARTSEGKLQVELAHLEYQKSRLVRAWTHLERQRGGFGFLGGPGESQIETDRRLIRDRIARIKKELDKTIRTRNLHRNVRREIPYTTVALVGYTNAGKSTLFNRLTKSQVMAKDMLFATLDPTIRAVALPSGMRIMLSDTVGFISNLPHELVAAFRATLEEVLEADLILHVRDISHADSYAQKEDVVKVLKELFGEASSEISGDADQHTPFPKEENQHHIKSISWSERMIEVGNKIDLLPSPDLQPLASELFPVSAVTGAGCDALLAEVERRLTALLMETRTITLPASDGKAIAWLHQHGTVTNYIDDEGGMLTLTVCLTTANAARFDHLYPAQYQL